MPSLVTFRIICRTSFNAIWLTSRERRRKPDGRKRPLRKPVATPDRNPIHSRNLETPPNRVDGACLQNRSFPQRHEKSCRPSALFPSARQSTRNPASHIRRQHVIHVSGSSNVTPQRSSLGKPDITIALSPSDIPCARRYPCAPLTS